MGSVHRLSTDIRSQVSLLGWGGGGRVIVDLLAELARRSEECWIVSKKRLQQKRHSPCQTYTSVLHMKYQVFGISYSVSPGMQKTSDFKFKENFQTPRLSYVANRAS